MRQGVVHVLHVHHVILLIPDAVLPGKQVREELGKSQTRGINTRGMGGDWFLRACVSSGRWCVKMQHTAPRPQLPKFPKQKTRTATGCMNTRFADLYS